MFVVGIDFQRGLLIDFVEKYAIKIVEHANILCEKVRY